MSDRYAMSVPSSESERRLQEIGRKYAHMIIPRSNEDVQLSDFRDTTEPDEGRNTMSDPIEMTAGADTLAWDIFRADNANVPESELRSDFPANAEYAINIAKHLRSAGYQKPRTATTAEELDALAVGDVVVLRDAQNAPVPAQKGDYGWRLPFVEGFWTAEKLLAGSESAEVIA